MKWPWGKKSIEKKSASSGTANIPIAPGSFLEYALTGGGAVLPHQAMLFYRENAAIATAVDLIAGAFEQIQPVLEIEDRKGELSFDSDHEVIQKLKNPNEFEVWKEFSGEMSRHYLLTHNSLLSGLGGVRRPPLVVYVVKTQNVSVTEQFNDGFPDRYIVSKGAGNGVYVRGKASGDMTVNFYDGSLKELYHVMGFSSRTNNVWGDSPLEAAAMDAKQQIEGRVHNLQMIKQGGRLSLVVSFKDEEPIEDDEHKARKQRIYEDLSGASNAGKIAVISGQEVDIKEVGTTNKDMDYSVLDQTAAFTIYNRYRIPLPLVTVTAAKFNNMQMAVEQLYDFAVLPHANCMYGGLSRFMLPRYGLDLNKFRITYNPKSITALKARMLEELKKRRDMNIETTNELRAEGLAKDGVDGGDVIYQGANLIPIGESSVMDDDVDPDEKAKKLLERDGLL